MRPPFLVEEGGVRDGLDKGPHREIVSKFESTGGRHSDAPDAFGAVADFAGSGLAPAICCSTALT